MSIVLNNRKPSSEDVLLFPRNDEQNSQVIPLNKDNKVAKRIRELIREGKEAAIQDGEEENTSQ